MKRKSRVWPCSAQLVFIVFYAFFPMHCILCFVFYALYSMHLFTFLQSRVFELTLKLVDTIRPTDIVMYRAAIAAKNVNDMLGTRVT